MILIRQADQYWYFLDKGFRFQSSVCDGFPNVVMMPININRFAILNIHDVDYCCIFGICQSEIISLLINADLSEKGGLLENIKSSYFCVLYKRWVKKFGDIEIEKRKFHCSKYPVNISNKVSLCKKGFK